MTNVHALPNQQVLLTTLPLDMTTTANLVAAVKATAIGCSTDQARPILTNVLVIVGDGKIDLIATNSYMLFVTSIGGIEMPAGYHAEFMIKGKQLVAAMPKARALTQLIIDHDSLIIHDPINKTDTKLGMQEGTFPNWQGLISEDPASRPITVAMNPKWMGDIAKAGMIFGKTAGKESGVPIIMRTGSTEMKPMFFDMNVVDRGTFFALLMPVRT